jgi:hypothetical protein
MCKITTKVKIINPVQATLMGLSHEIDFNNFEKKFTELGLTKGRGWF